jgi:hypothetical protein
MSRFTSHENVGFSCTVWRQISEFQSLSNFYKIEFKAMEGWGEGLSSIFSFPGIDAHATHVF